MINDGLSVRLGFLTTRGERVMASVSQFIVVKLKLKVNREKSAVARPWDRKFLGFSFSRDRSRNGALPGHEGSASGAWPRN